VYDKAAIIVAMLKEKLHIIVTTTRHIRQKIGIK
jgi:hypothetical protein